MWSINILYLQGVNVKFLYDHMSFGLPKKTHCLNPIRYHGAYFENVCCHQSPSTTQSIEIYDHSKISSISQSLLLILTQVKYPLNVESPCSIVAWWIMTIDSLASWFTIGPIWCASHTLVHSPWENDSSPLQFCHLILAQTGVINKIYKT